MSNLIKKSYRYKFTEYELKEKLGLTGKIILSGLWSGQSPNKLGTDGYNPKQWIYYIETEENEDDSS